MTSVPVEFLTSLISKQESYPEPLVQELHNFAQNIAAPFDIDTLASEEAQQQFLKAVVSSQFLRDHLVKQPERLTAIVSDQALKHDNDLPAYIQGRLQNHLINCEDSTAFNRQLRLFRNELMAEIIFLDLNRLINTAQTCMRLSLMAEYCLQAALNFHSKILKQRYGTPRDAGGNEQGLLILGMGKLGAWELNLSSDIDLIFAFPERGQTDHETNARDNQEYFSQLGKAVIQSLDTRTADGFVFRVDMRLRPWGDSGALVSHFDGLEHYYQIHGREWERYAMVKARIVASNCTQEKCDELMDMLGNFTYRQYIDFSVIDALRDLKKTINNEVKRKKLFEDIKRGNGGIREIEFIAQVFQLIRGGRDLQLRDNRLLHIYPKLVALGVMPADTAQKLTDAYIFLRNTEHVIQGYRDEQTQMLPEDELARFCIAHGMGYSAWGEFYKVLSEHRDYVHREFQAVIAAPEDNPSAGEEQDWKSVWQKLDGAESNAYLQESFTDSKTASALLRDLQESHAVRTMQSSSRQRLDDFVPLLLNETLQTDEPLETLKRTLPLVQSVARRSAYLLLLIENPSALKQLVSLAAVSPWIAEQLSKHPALLDELLDARTLYHAPNKTELEQELKNHMAAVERDDLERQMEHLRYFRSAHALRVAACEVQGTLPLTKVSDYLSYLAEAILDYVLILAWEEMVGKNGYPDGDVREKPNFVIIGYGKVGGMEMGHSSDLDLVFIHNADMNGSTDGESRGLRSIDNHTFYTRLGQKIIHVLNTKTISGQLYEVDMRLRPSGNSGLLVTTLNAFEKYQRDSAWTWEHQALVRARALSGENYLAQKFESIRGEILQRSRDLPKLQEDVAAMRKKMRDHLGSAKSRKNKNKFHLKQDAGGIVDIEFMVQYAVLAWSHIEPGLATYTDNIRILESLEQSKMLPSQEVEQLIEAYKAFRSVGHRLALQKLPNFVDGDSLNSERQIVVAIWKKMLSE